MFEIGRPRSRGWKNFGCRWTREVGGLENWTIFMDVICISSLKILKYAKSGIIYVLYKLATIRFFIIQVLYVEYKLLTKMSRDLESSKKAMFEVFCI